MERFANQAVRFLVTIVLARLLAPEDFGLLGMLAVFITISNKIVESGFGQALIQKQNATLIDESTVFYFNFLIGVFMAGVLFVCAPLIAAFYNQPILISLIRVLALNIIFYSLGFIHITLLIKKIDFKSLFKVQFLSTVLSGGTGIFFAYHGFGVWSLVFQSMVSSLALSLSAWVVSRWRPMFDFSLESLKDMFGFGSRLLMAGIINSAFENIYLIIIGKIYSPSALGYYTQAKKLQEIPVKNINTIVSRVAFPVFSSIQSEKYLLRESIKKALSTLVLIVFPVMTGLAVVADNFVNVVLTPKWTPSIPYIRLLCVIGAMLPLHMINLNVLKALGRSDIYLRLELIKKALVVISVMITYRWGIEAMLYGGIIVSVIGFYLNSYHTGRSLNYTAVEQIIDLLPYLCISLVMGSIVYAQGLYLNIESKVALLVLQVVSGVFMYMGLFVLVKPKQFQEIRLLVTEKLVVKN